MIKITVLEDIEGNYAKHDKKVTFLGIPLYKLTSYTSNQNIVSQFKEYKDINIKGFSNEN